MRPIPLLLTTVMVSVLMLSTSVAPVRAASGDNEAAPSDTASPPDAAPPAAGPQGRNGIPAFSHIIIVTLENKELNRIAGNSSAPFLNRLAGEYTLATRFYAETHPSLPNYLAMLAGNTFGVDSDCLKCFQNAVNLVDQFEASGISWTAYFESMPRPCYVGDSPNGLYAQKHNPFIYFDGVRNDPGRCAKIVPLDRLSADLAAGALPSFIWIGPNLRSSTHDGSIAEGDRWLSDHLTDLLHSPVFEQDGLLVVTYDEGDSDDGCCGQRHGGGRIATVIASPLARRGYTATTPYNHYSLLRTIEDAWGLDYLGHAGDASVSNFADVFAGAAQP